MKSLLLIFWLAILVTLGQAQASGSRPNILFVFSDDHALEAISAYKSRFMELAPTPNLERIAREGAIFENSFCANSICGPPRACILTGKHSHLNGFRRNRDRYLSTVKAVDESVGRLLDYLDNNGLTDNTIVIYSSDQGFYLGEHGWYDKRWMFEESFKMPFLIRWPGAIEPGTRPIECFVPRRKVLRRLRRN